SRVYSAFFRGTLNPKAKSLILSLDKLSDLTNLQLAIPLGRDATQLSFDGRLTSVSPSGFGLVITVANEGGDDFIAEFRGSDLSLTDDTGKAYTLSNQPGTTVEVIGSNQSRVYSFYFRGPL